MPGSMQDFVEKQIGELRVRIDRLLCVGFGDCAAAAPELFEFDGDGICAFKADAPPIERDRLLRVCDVCPVDALVVIDENGAQLVP